MKDILDIRAPHSKEAEKNIIGVFLGDPSLIDEAIDSGLNKNDFYLPHFGDAWSILSEMRASGIAIDISTVAQYATDHKYSIDLPQLGLASASFISFDPFKEYLKTILDKSKLRKLQALCKNIIYETIESEHDPEKVISMAEKGILGIESESVKDFRTQEDVSRATLNEVAVVMEKREELNKQGKSALPVGLPSGFRELDRMTTGFKEGQMVIIAARPSVGKTSFVMQLKDTIAMAGFPVGVITLEMSPESLMLKSISGKSGVDMRHIRAGNIHSEEYDKLNSACYDVGKLPIIYVDVPRMSVASLISKSRRLVTKFNVKAIVIDYIQLMRGDENKDRFDEVNQISFAIKSLARELNIVMIAVAQLNRKADEGEPQMYHLRESGNLEQDADIILLLHKKEQQAHHKQFEYPMSLIMAKHREGPVTKIDLTFDGERTRFIE